MKYTKYFTPQINEKDCGAAALSTILKFYGSNYTLTTLKKITHTNKNGTSALNIIKAASKLGLSAIGVTSDLSHIKDKKPFIAQVITHNGFAHFIVVFNITEKSVVVSDPNSSTGISKLTLEEFKHMWTGIALLFTVTDKFIPYKEKNVEHIKYLQLLKTHLNMVLKLIFLSIITLTIEVAGAYFSQLLLDKYIPLKSINPILTVSVLLSFAYIFQQIISFLQGILTTNLYTQMSQKMIFDFLNHVTSLPLLSFQTMTTGDFTSRIDDSYQIINSFSKMAISLFLNSITVLGLTIILFLQSKVLFSITLMAIPTYLLVFLSFSKPFKLNKQKVSENKAVFDSKLIETVKGIETIKSLNIEKENLMILKKHLNIFIRASMHLNKLQFLQQSLNLGLNSILNTLVLALGALQIINRNLNIGQLITFSILLSFFSDALHQLIALQADLQSAKVAKDRMNEIFLLPSEKISLKDKIPFHICSQITVKNLTYRYDQTDKGLFDISFSIPFKSKVAIVGTSGSGKSTLGKILSGLYPLTNGLIMYDKISSNDLSVATIRKNIQYIPQTPNLFNGSILDNLLYGINREISSIEIKKVCHLVELADDIEKMPQKFNTFITESGASLSGGQKQRLALARALLSDSKVLILDESTSALDRITENKIVNNLLSIQSKTIIFIAHHLSIAKQVDNIILLKDGRLVGLGTHNSLLKNSKYYQTLNLK